MKKNTASPAHRISVAYVRVSTDQQASEGISLEAQEARLRAAAVAKGITDLEVRVESKSAKSISGRPVLTRTLQDIEAGRVSSLLVFKLDRLTRNTVETLELVERLERYTCKLISLSEDIDTSSATGRFFLTVLAALGQMEREQLGERTRMALAHKIANGAKLGRAPTGYRKAKGADGKLTALVEDKAGQELVSRLREFRAEGLSLKQIAKRLQADGVLTPRGSADWNVGTLSKIVRRLEPVQAA